MLGMVPSGSLQGRLGHGPLRPLVLDRRGELEKVFLGFQPERRRRALQLFDLFGQRGRLMAGERKLVFDGLHALGQ